MIVRTTTVTEVKLDSDAVEDVFKQKLDAMCGGDHVWFDEKEQTVKSWDDTGHGSGLTNVVKDATPRQIAALKFRSALQDIARATSKAGDDRLRKEMRKGRKS